MPYTAYALKRLVLLLVEMVILRFGRGDHSIGYRDRVLEAADAIKQFRDMYYPAPTKIPARRRTA